MLPAELLHSLGEFTPFSMVFVFRRCGGRQFLRFGITRTEHCRQASLTYMWRQIETDRRFSRLEDQATDLLRATSFGLAVSSSFFSQSEVVKDCFVEMRVTRPGW